MRPSGCVGAPALRPRRTGSCCRWAWPGACPLGLTGGGARLFKEHAKLGKGPTLGVEVPSQRSDLSSDALEQDTLEIGLLQNRAHGTVNIENAVRRLVLILPLLLGRLHERLQVVHQIVAIEVLVE